MYAVFIPYIILFDTCVLSIQIHIAILHRICQKYIKTKQPMPSIKTLLLSI